MASSLNYVSISDEKSPVLHPYPTWEANTLETEDEQVSEPSESTGNSAFFMAWHCLFNQPQTIIGGRASAPKAIKSEGVLQNNATIISTFRIRVDECDRLWVMDTGLADILGNPKQLAPPALVIFDLKTDQLIRRYSFAESDAKEDTFFANVVCVFGEYSSGFHNYSS